MKKLATQSIESIPAISRIAEIQQRIKDIQRIFGIKISDNKFQATLEQEMEKIKPLPKVKPIEQFLAENKLPPVNENAEANAQRIATILKSEDKATEAVKIYDSSGIDEKNSNSASQIRTENAAPTATEEMIEAAARHYGVESDLVKAIATAESNMNQEARSYVGAIGVMQLMPETAESLGVDPYDERQNIEGGAHYVRQMLDKFNGNLKNAIAAYNAGPGAVQKYGGVPPYSETQNYVGRVLDFYVK